MVSPIAALVVSLALPAAAADCAPKKPAFGTKAFGEGGGYKHPDACVGDFFEQAPGRKPDSLNPSRPGGQGPEITPDRAPAPADARPERARPRPFPDASQAGAPSRPESERPSDAGRNAPAAEASAPEIMAPTSLWSGKLKPLTPGAEAASIDGAAESDDARRGFEEKLLGAAPEAERARFDEGSSLSLTPSSPDAAALEAAGTEGALFVSLELDPREAGSLRDAVAGLGAAASFRPDPRFDAAPAGGGNVRVSGWLPVSRLGDAIARPGVKRVSVERGARPAPSQGLHGPFLVGLRIADAARPEESIAAGVRDLTANAGFKVRRVYGVETGPDGGAVAVIAGTLPLSRLGDAMSRPNVVKVTAAMPVPSAETPSSEPGEAPSKTRGFLNFVLTRGLWLALLTVLLALPSLGDAVKAGLSVFVPYR
jgi:hypothetical protein